MDVDIRDVAMIVTEKLEHAADMIVHGDHTRWAKDRVADLTLGVETLCGIYKRSVVGKWLDSMLDL